MGYSIRAAIFYSEYTEATKTYTEKIWKRLEVVNALAKYKPQMRLATNGVNHIKELLQNTQSFNEPI
jgi:hypothetical protein